MDTTETNTPQTKRAALLTIIDRARALEQTLADFFDETARAATGTVEDSAPLQRPLCTSRRLADLSGASAGGHHHWQPACSARG